MELKGVSLSIETIVIIVICVLVLVVVVLFFSGSVNPPASGIEEEAKLRSECNEWRWHFYSSDYFFSGNCTNLRSRFNITEAKDYCTGMEGTEPPSGPTTPPPTPGSSGSTPPTPG